MMVISGGGHRRRTRDSSTGRVESDRTVIEPVGIQAADVQVQIADEVVGAALRPPRRDSIVVRRALAAAVVFSAAGTEGIWRGRCGPAIESS
jgi:hypothetical protein